MGYIWQGTSGQNTTSGEEEEVLPPRPTEFEPLREFLRFTGFWSRLRYFAPVAGFVLLSQIIYRLPPFDVLVHNTVVGISAVMFFVALLGSFVLLPLVRRHQRAARNVVVIQEEALRPEQVAALYKALASARASSGEAQTLFQLHVLARKALMELSLQVGALQDKEMDDSVLRLKHLIYEMSLSTQRLQDINNGIPSTPLLPGHNPTYDPLSGTVATVRALVEQTNADLL